MLKPMRVGVVFGTTDRICQKLNKPTQTKVLAQ